ncbi:hypothetical protein PMAYCL1PPCAC_09633, partial [Pristionchus mayeri]
GDFGRREELDWNEAKEINRGGQGIVYRVPSGSGESFAVKTRVSLEEIDRLIKLKHRNIVKFLFVTTHNDQPAMAMEYADRNLRQHLNRSELGNPAFIDIICGTADGLAYIHEEGLVHRDIKSENILIQIQSTGKCVAKISDFGIAREIPTCWVRHQIIGSYQYMAPELLVPRAINGYDAEDERKRVAELEPRIDT